MTGNHPDAPAENQFVVRVLGAMEREKGKSSQDQA